MAKIIRRVIGGICIISALLLIQIPAGVSNAASAAKENFLMDNNTLVKYTGTATTVSVSDEVKIIGAEAFADNQYVGVINLGKNVKEIEHGAFTNCNYLNKIVIPDSVKKIDSAAFSGCSGLVHVSIGSNVEEFGDGVFAGCLKLGGISVARDNDKLYFEAGVLYDKNKEHIYTYLSANPYDIYYMPETVDSISPYSFWGNENLKEVYLSGSLEEVPAYAFSNCKNLKIVQISSSVDSIDAKAFENCISLSDIIIPASVKYIDPTAFDGCYNLNIIADEGTVGAEFFKTFDKSDIATVESQDAKTHVENIGNTSSNPSNSGSTNRLNSDGLIDASNDPSNVEWMPSVSPLNSSEDNSIFGKTIIVGGNAVLFVDRDMKINQITNEELEKQIEENQGNDDSDSNVIFDSGKGGYLPKYTYINGNIASQAFYASQNDEDFIIKDGTKKIGKFSFARSCVKSIEIPYGVEEIGYGAFYHCDDLNSVKIPSSVKKIDEYAFDNTPYKANKLSDCNNPFWIEGDGILLGYCGNDSSVIIPDSVKVISSGCFKDNTNISSVSIPSSVQSIETDAFRGCTKLKTVTGAENVSLIGDRAFMGCPVGGFVVSANVKSIGLRAFDFSDTNLLDSEKVIIFEGDELPVVKADESSKRLSNYLYRQDALYNVVFAVVGNGVNSFEGTVLDSDTLGFSGVIVNRYQNENNDNSRSVLVNRSYIYSQDVLERIPDQLIFNDTEFDLIGKDQIGINSNPYQTTISSKDIQIDSYVSGASANFSEEENVGKLIIKDSELAKKVLNQAYNDLFAEDIENLTGYDISLLDSKGVVEINKLGKTSLYISLPAGVQGEKYHVISLDEDGQLEELPLSFDPEKNMITFETTHLSYFGIYSTGSDNVVLNVKDGKLVKNYRLDDSPETGDNSLSIYYVYSVLLIALGLILILYKKKKY